MTTVERRIPVMLPFLGEEEAQAAAEAVRSGWVAQGPRVAEFEKRFAAAAGAAHGIAVSSCTTALHLALITLGVGPGDEVVVPSLSFIATANAARYVGATPVFADVEPVSYGIDAESVRALVTPRTKAIVVVHLYGHPVDFDPIADIAAEHGLFVVEDATEALGSRYRGRLCGTLGDVGCFSFNGNKVMTTGGGGMVLARDPERLAHMRRLTFQGRVPGREYIHDEVGFNYAMSNLPAAVGVAQMEELDGLLARRRAVAERYAAALAGVPGLEFCREAEWAQTNWWLQSVLVDAERYGEDRNELMDRLAGEGIEARPFFHPLHRLPPYAEFARGELPMSDRLHATGVSIPSSASLEPSQQDRVIAALARR
ncbi:MAG: perosamine synthetase [Micromonosporaceae bacterium]